MFEDAVVTTKIEKKSKPRTKVRIHFVAADTDSIGFTAKMDLDWLKKFGTKLKEIAAGNGCDLIIW